MGMVESSDRDLLIENSTSIRFISEQLLSGSKRMASIEDKLDALQRHVWKMYGMAVVFGSTAAVFVSVIVNMAR